MFEITVLCPAHADRPYLDTAYAGQFSISDISRIPIAQYSDPIPALMTCSCQVTQAQLDMLGLDGNIVVLTEDEIVETP